MKKFISVLFAIFAFTMPATACESNEIDTGSACVESKFSVTTSETDVFKFIMSARGTFYVDCGNGGVLSSSADDVSGKKIIHNNIDLVTYTCSWTASEEQTIRFAGRATRYRVNGYDTTIGFSCSIGEKNQIKTIDGSLGAIFSTLGQQSGQQPRFIQTFGGCTKITSIPSELFSGVTGGTASMFLHTFNGCSSLTAIPTGLFAGITNAVNNMFNQAFYSCRNLSGYIPSSAFSGLFANGSPTAQYMWYYAFISTKLRGSCPTGTVEVNTNYKGGDGVADNAVKWGNFVSCYDPTPQTCAAGEYLPRYYDSCIECPSGSACAGGTYSFDETTDQGIVACANGTFSPSGSAVCYPHILHVGDSNVYLKSTKQTTPSLNIKIGNDVFYANMIIERTRMSKDSSHYLHVKTADNVHYYVCDDTVCPQ